MPRGVKSGRHRSSSTSSYNDAVAVSSVGRGAANLNSSLSNPTSPEDLDSCNKLFALLASDLSSGGSGPGGNFLHQLATIGGGGSSDVSVNELSIAHVLLERAAQVDRANAELRLGSPANKKGTKTNPSDHRSDHVKSLLLAADLECVYTPLHSAMNTRSLRSILLLLRHAASRVEDEQSADVQLMNRIRLHPILMLDGDESSGLRSAQKNRSPNDDILLMNMVLARDAEGLTPLGLLCKSMSSDLARCRGYLAQQRLDALGLAASGRDRSIDLVDDTDEEDDDTNDRVGGGRLRGTSFGNIHDVDLDADGVDGAAVAALQGRGNEFEALRGT